MTHDQQRKLAAILAADIAGYSALMGADDEATVRDLKGHQSVILPMIGEHKGRVIDTAGDGVLAEFASVLNAVKCAVAMQTTMAGRNAAIAPTRRIQFRIGINLGDVIYDEARVYGDGVNIAARLESIAEPGGICVSGKVYQEMRGKIDVLSRDLGPHTLKNISEPVRVYCIDVIGVPGPLTTLDSAPKELALALPDRPSIAVLSFTNMSSDPEQEYFADGMVEEVITALSHFRGLFVIARNSSFSYKGTSPDIRRVGKDLGVRYVLEGSIRRAGNRIRVTAQLIDSVAGSHIWAERYDRELEGIFAVQEELTQSIVLAIMPEIETAEQEKLRRRRPESLGAYEIAVRAWAKASEAHIKNDRALRDAAIREAKAALGIDAGSTLALNALAYAQFQHVNLGTAADHETAWQEGMAAATRAIEADRSDGIGYGLKGRLLVLAPNPDRIDEALTNARQGHTLNPHHMLSLTGLAFIEILAGNPQYATEHLQHAMRISPRDPARHLLYLQLAQASFCSGLYANGVDYALRGIGEAPEHPPLHTNLAANYVGLGEIAKAKAAIEVARRCGSEYVTSRLAGGSLYRKPEHHRRATIFLRVSAGLEDPSTAEALR